MGPTCSNLFQSSEWPSDQIIAGPFIQEKQIQYYGSTTKANNYIWCGAIVLAWKELKHKVFHQDILLQTDNPNIKNYIKSLNKHPFSKTDISKRSVYVKAGQSQDTLRLINKQCANKFNNFKQLTYTVGPRDLLVYAHLFKKLQFSQVFQKSQGSYFNFNGKKVQSFYAKTVQQKKQIFYLQYEDQDNFLFGIYSKKQKDLIYFAKNTKKLTQNQLFQKIQKGQSQRKQIDHDDKFGMPQVKINHSRIYKQFLGIHFANDKFRDQFITLMQEQLSLQINQRGATVQFKFGFGAGCYIPKARQFILDKSFWTVMKQKGKRPYFCAFIQSPIDI